jgi:putative transposase
VEYVRTLKVPVHYLTTRKKVSYIDNLTARLTYAVRLFCERISEEGRIPESRKDIREYSPWVQEKTGLSAGFIQQAEDKTLWMWGSYKKKHQKWEWMLRKAKVGGKWYRKLLKREPSPPCGSKRSKLKKIPVRFDCRTGQVQKAKLALTSWVIHISTLKKGETIDILLNPSEYSERLLKEGEIRDFEIVKRNGWYYIHITCIFKVQTQPVQRFVGVDLGICRNASTVSINPANPRPSDFHIFKDGKRRRLQELNDRVSHLRRIEKWEALKRLRNKRRNVAEDYDWKLAKTVAESCANAYVFLGDPEYIRYHNYRGNGDRTGRKLLQNWSFNRQAHYIQRQCAKRGVQSEALNEWGTSSRCHRCGAKVERPKQPRIICHECGLQDDAERNSSINIAWKGISRLGDKSLASLMALNRAEAPDERAQTTDDSTLEPSMSVEATHFNGW